MRALPLIVAAAAVLLAAPACRGHQSAEPLPLGVPATLHVENHHWLDVNILVLHDGQRTRLGTVTATSVKDFVFPNQLLADLGEIRLIADPVGSTSSLTTELIVLKPGTRVQWTLESSLQRSSLAVY